MSSEQLDDGTEGYDVTNQCLSHVVDGLMPGHQTNLFGETIIEDVPRYLSDQLITYLGNKRSLITKIDEVVSSVKSRLGKDRIRVLDAFSGSGVVARYFKRHAEFLATIDIEDYATVVSRCYLRNRSVVDMRALSAIVDDLNNHVDTAQFPVGFIEDLYAPRCEEHITKDDRVFYTRRNARRLDNYQIYESRVW